MTPSEMISPS